MYLQFMVRSMISILIPYKPYTFFSLYTWTVEQIIFYRNRTVKLQFYFLIFCCLYSSIIIFISSQFGEHKRFESFILADMVLFTFEQQDNHLHNILISFFSVSIYLIKVLYLNVNIHLMPLLQLFLIESKDKTIILNKIKQNNKFLKPILPIYRGQKVMSYHRNVTHLITNSLEMFKSVAILQAIYYHWLFINLTIKYKKRLFGSLFGWCLYTFHWFNLLIFDISIFTFVEVCINTASIGLSFLVYISIRFYQNILILNQKCDNLRWKTVRIFIRNDLINFQNLFLLNQMFGPMLTIFILVNMPCNAFLMTRYIFKFDTFNIVTQVVGLAILGQQFLCLILFHLLAVNFSNRAHRSTKHLFRLMTYEWNCIRLVPNRLKVNLTISRLHTTNRYGVTYGKLSLITFQTFTRVNIIIF